MTSITSADARAKFSELINRAGYGKERFIITKNKKEVAAIVPAETISLLKKLEDYFDLEVALKAKGETKLKGEVSLKEIERLVRGGST